MSVAAWESLHKATLELAKPAALKQRLTDAYTRFLLDLSPAEMPGELRSDFEALRQCMTRIRPLPGESAVAATVRKMSIHEADDCAARIVALLDALHRTSVMPVKAQGPGPGRALSSNEASSSRIPTLISVNRA